MTDLLDQTPARPRQRRGDLGDCNPVLAFCPLFATVPVGILSGSCPAVVDLANLTEAGLYCWHCSGTADYPATTIDGRKTRLHRFICQDDAETIDHRNGDQTDNRSCNLRPATYGQNRRNLPGSPTRRHETADLWRECAKCSLPCLDYPDIELALVAVADANYPGVDRAQDLLPAGYEYLGPTTADDLANVTEGADAVVVLCPSWTHNGTAKGMLRRLAPWLGPASEIDPCVALMRPGPTFDHLARPDLAEGLDSLALALRCGCESGSFCFVNECEELDPDALPSWLIQPGDDKKAVGQ